MRHAFTAVCILTLPACDRPSEAARSSAGATAIDHRAAFPSYTAPVVDTADVIPYEIEQRLNATLMRFQQRTTDQLAIVTIPTLKGEKVESYSRRLFTAWGVGLQGKDNGVGLIVAPNDHAIRIEVGRGLENTLTNEECARIIAKEIMPHFQRGDLPAGIEAGANAIIAHLQ